MVILDKIKRWVEFLCPKDNAVNGCLSNADWDILCTLGVSSISIPPKKQQKLGYVLQKTLQKVSQWNLEDKARTPADRLINSQILGLSDYPLEGVYIINTSKRGGRLVKKITLDEITPSSNGDLIFGNDFFISADDIDLFFSKEHRSGKSQRKMIDPNGDTSPTVGRYEFLGMGGSSFVIFDKENFSAYKFTRRGREEIRLLHKLSSLSVQKNTLHIKRVVEFGEVDIMELEYVFGKSLHQHLEEETLLLERIIQYSSGILNGLLELRQAGIWHHRDIRPANIMIDEEKGRAVIIDLGIATTNKDALAKDNRRFGSPPGRRANDLNSLGQVVYKMATGEHIFAESKSMERTTYADKLRDHRDWIYERPEERLPPYLKKVEEAIKDRGLCGIVKFCLESEGTSEDYQTLEARFKEYGA